MVQIANPIYDVVFKYLMNDEKVAKLLLTAIIGREVVSLEFRPAEHHFPVELEQLLVLFDQSGATDDPHFLRVNEEDLPERYRPLLRRLQKAIADPVIRQTMEAEDDLIEEFRDYQRLISEKDRVLEEKQRQLQNAILELYASGMDIEKLSGIFHLTVKEIETILEKKSG